jgi:hypothetical protein
LVYFVVIWFVFPKLVCCTQKNLATLAVCSYVASFQRWLWRDPFVFGFLQGDQIWRILNIWRLFTLGRYCEFSTFGECFTLGSYFENNRSSKNLRANFFFGKAMYVFISTKNWEFFSQTHLVTLDAMPTLLHTQTFVSLIYLFSFFTIHISI